LKNIYIYKARTGSQDETGITGQAKRDRQKMMSITEQAGQSEEGRQN
jgi:hypothetical protein